VRRQAGRHPHASAAIVDSQSVKTTEAGGPRGYDAGKNVAGRKRHLLVDSLGLPLIAVVTPANVHDGTAAARWLFGGLSPLAGSAHFTRAFRWSGATAHMAVSQRKSGRDALGGASKSSGVIPRQLALLCSRGAGSSNAPSHG
jgi:hypothetical protein